MKNIIKITVAIFFLGMISCDYLDVVPNDAPDLHHAFSNRSVAEKFLRTCYSHLPDITDPFFYPTWFTSRDEVICDGDSRSNRSAAAMIADGAQNTNDPYQNYWTGINGGKPLYVAIRDCNIFLNNIHIPQDIQEEERSRWIGEVKFLKAYYHFFLLQLYGPIVIADEEEPLSATPEELQVYREPVDVCVDYIANLLDEAILLLPESSRHQYRTGKNRSDHRHVGKSKIADTGSQPPLQRQYRLQGMGGQPRSSVDIRHLRPLEMGTCRRGYQNCYRNSAQQRQAIV